MRTTSSGTILICRRFTRQVLEDIARHIIECLVTQGTRVRGASDDLAGNRPGS